MYVGVSVWMSVSLESRSDEWKCVWEEGRAQTDPHFFRMNFPT